MRTERCCCDSCKKEIDILQNWNKVVININGMPKIELDLCNDCCYKFLDYIQNSFQHEDGIKNDI